MKKQISTVAGILIVLLVAGLAGLAVLVLSQVEEKIEGNKKEEDIVIDKKYDELNLLDYCWNKIDSLIGLQDVQKVDFEEMEIEEMPEDLYGSESWEEIDYCFKKIQQNFELPSYVIEIWEYLNECVEEGEIKCGPMGCRKCCNALTSRPVASPYVNKSGEIFCLEEMTMHVCVNCGDGICGKGEDWCVCPEDCKKPKLEELDVFQLVNKCKDFMFDDCPSGCYSYHGPSSCGWDGEFEVCTEDLISGCFSEQYDPFNY